MEVQSRRSLVELHHLGDLLELIAEARVGKNRRQCRIGREVSHDVDRLVRSVARRCDESGVSVDRSQEIKGVAARDGFRRRVKAAQDEHLVEGSRRDRQWPSREALAENRRPANRSHDRKAGSAI